MSAVVGIDLGTTNTVVAAVRGGRAMALATESGTRLLPSVVAFQPNGSVVVGRKAKARKRQDAANTIYSTKRLIGRSFESEEVRKARARAAFKIQEGPGRGVLVVARGESYTLSEISAFILKEAKRVAEAALGDKVERAVVTVPANFNDLQRAATKVAGHIAGVEVLRILNEPTAAALAYGYGKGNQERIVVYDFGGGTFDVTLLDLAGNVFEVLATSGDTFLGGDDIDYAIAERIADRFLATHRYDARSDRQVFERVVGAAEEVKIKLSSTETATVHLKDVAYGPGGKAMDMPFSMTRQELDQLVVPFVDRTLRVCQDALGVARLEPSEFDQVILVGGTTRIPAVRKRVAEFFGRKPLEKLSADEVVALGAAIQASALAGSERKRGGTAAMKAPPRVTDVGLGSGQTLGVGMVPAPVPTGSSSTQRQVRWDGDGAAVIDRDVRPTAPHGAPVDSDHTVSNRGQAPRPARLTKQAHASSDSPSTASDRSVSQGADAAPPPSSDILLPLVQSDEATSPDGLRVLDEDPTELRSATKPLRDLESSSDRIAPGSTTARMAAAPPIQTSDPKGTMRMEVASPSPPEQPPGRSTAQVPPERAVVPQIDKDVISISDIAAATAAAAATGAAVAGAEPPAAPQVASPDMAKPNPAESAVAPVTPAWTPPPAATRRGTDRPAPLLVDVTPLSLAVETVGGYCDVIIERNTPVPCERTRMFTTASDNQTMVRISVAQGESKRFSENALLGQVELSGLRGAARGEVQVALTFEMDSDGILNVRAKDTKTGKVAEARMQLGGGVPETGELEAMRARIDRLS